MTQVLRPVANRDANRFANRDDRKSAALADAEAKPRRRLRAG